MPTPIQRLASLFEGNDTHHGTHGVPSRDPTGASLKWVIKPTAKTLKRGPTTDDWKKHVDGERPLGISPIRQDNSAIWGSIDYDVYDQDLLATLQRVEGSRLPLVPCRSKSGGLHLFIFATEPVPARKIQDVLRECAASLGMSNSEIFPKQATLLVDRGDQGSWMIMPYFGSDFDGKLQMQHGLRSDGGDIGLSEFVRLAERARQTPAQLDELQVRSITPKSEPKKGNRKAADRGPTKSDDTTVPFGDGPPCLVHLTSNGGVPQGGQNSTLFHMGVYYKKKYPDDWVSHLQKAAQTLMNPPYPLSQLDGVVKSHSKRDYQYKCKDEPMASHCDSILCRMKRFGVTGTGGTIAPKIESIKKLDSQPPVWFIDIEGAKVECQTEDLQRWDRMQKLLIEKLNNPFGVIPQPVWLSIVQEAMGKMSEEDIIKVSQDAGVEGEFVELLEIFLTNRQRGLKEEDLLLGRPWENEEEGRHYFTLIRLSRFMKREGMESMKRPQIAARLYQLKGGHIMRKIKGKLVALHWVPSSMFYGTPSVDPPKVPGKPI